MKTAIEILDEEFKEVGVINFMNGMKLLTLKQWDYPSCFRTIKNAMEKYAKQISEVGVEPEVKPLLADEEFKNIFIDIVLSNYRLGCAEYNRNPAYNDTHYHYKAEEKMMYYLQDNYPELWKEIGKKVLEIDSKQSV